MRLQNLNVGDQAKIVQFSEGGRSFRKKLLSMGLTPGTTVTITRFAPLGDPIEIKLRGFSLSLRKSEANMLEVEKIA